MLAYDFNIDPYDTTRRDGSHVTLCCSSRNVASGDVA